MPTVVKTITVPANGQVDSCLAGSVYERLPWNALAEIGIVADAAGVQVTISSGSDVDVESGPADLAVAAGRLPVYPDQFHYNVEAAFNDILKITLRDTSGAQRTVGFAARLTPVA
jgi:hypothetical protein